MQVLAAWLYLSRLKLLGSERPKDPDHYHLGEWIFQWIQLGYNMDKHIVIIKAAIKLSM
jgi:hypothetical protein